MKKVFAGLVILLVLSSCLISCTEQDPQSAIQDSMTDTSNMDFTIPSEDINVPSGEGNTTICFTESGAEVNGNGASAEGHTVTITASGTYEISGESQSAHINVEASNKDKVVLLLAGATLSNLDAPVIYANTADKVTIQTKAGATSTLTDGATRLVDDTKSDGAIFARCDLTLTGEGTLQVTGRYAHAIVTKDDLVITSGTIEATAKKTALNGHDSVKIGGGNLILTAGSNGIYADNTEDESKGYVYISGGTIALTATTDGIQAQSVLNIEGGTIAITTGKGASSTSTSAKGLKATKDILISGGVIHIQSNDDGIHSNNCVVISGGNISISSGDDGIHADTALDISAGEIVIAKSYEGLESSDILIRGGNISIVASDDGMNAAGGNDGSGLGRPGTGGFFDVDENASITISGGYILVDAAGDGIDSNGALTVSGGILLISGPTNSGNGALDYGSTASITGGVVIATGASGMATNFTDATNQGAIMTSFSTVSGGKSIAICNASGAVIASFTPNKNYQSVVVSAPEIQKGGTYTIVVGGTVENTDDNGYVSQSTLTGGTTLATITMTSLLYGNGGMGGMPPGGGGGGGRPPRW